MMTLRVIAKRAVGGLSAVADAPEGTAAQSPGKHALRPAR